MIFLLFLIAFLICCLGICAFFLVTVLISTFTPYSRMNDLGWRRCNVIPQFLDSKIFMCVVLAAREMTHMMSKNHSLGVE